MKFLIYFLMSLFISHSYASEALRFAKFGCEVKKNQKACENYNKLLKLKNKKPKKSSTITFESKIKGKQGSVKFTVPRGMIDEAMKECLELTSSIAKCESYSCESHNPIANNFKEEHIVEKEKATGLCLYTRTLPNDGLLTCRLDEPQRLSFKNLKVNEHQERSLKINNWLQDGICKISGY